MQLYKLKFLFLMCVSYMVYGCATPASVQYSSDYEICRLSLLRPPLQSSQAISEADRQVRNRKLNCNLYASTIFQQQQEGLQQLQQGLDGMSNQRRSPANLNNQTTGITCFKTREWVSGNLKNCAYSCMGSEAVQTISSTQICPISIRR